MSQFRPANFLIELLSACFEWTDVATVVCASHVSGHWRAAARSSPAFWRTIRLAAFSPTALEFFVERLESSQTVGISVCVDSMKRSTGIGEENVLRTVTDALLRHLYRIEMLALRVRFFNLEELLVGLTLPAPLLRSLELVAYPCRSGDEFHLPLELFGGAVPCLANLKLSSISIPLEELHPWFNQLHTVYLFLGGGVIAPTIIERFPRATSIHLDLPRFPKIPWDPPFMTPVRVHHRLERVTCIQDFTPALIQWCAGVRHMEVGEPMQRQVQEILGQFQPGELAVALQPSTLVPPIPGIMETIKVEFRGDLVLGGMAGTRSFNAELQVFGLIRGSRFVDTVQLARISSLELTHSLLAESGLGLLQTLPCCKTLRIILDIWRSNGRFEENMGGTAMVFVPALKQVEIIARIPHLSAPEPQQLRTFLIRFIVTEEEVEGDGAGRGEPLHVSLKGFTWLPNYSELQDQFVVNAAS